jgi:dihydroorotase
MTALIFGGKIVNEGRVFDGSIIIENDRISEIKEGTETPRGIYDNVVDATGCFVLPGVIDEHVHFREPGLTAKADIESESRAAAYGGVTSYFEMPNTIPQTTTLDALAEKSKLASAKSHVNYSFFFGATNNNSDAFASPFIGCQVSNSLWVPAQAICSWINLAHCSRYSKRLPTWICH